MLMIIITFLPSLVVVGNVTFSDVGQGDNDNDQGGVSLEEVSGEVNRPQQMLVILRLVRTVLKEVPTFASPPRSKGTRVMALNPGYDDMDDGNAVRCGEVFRHRGWAIDRPRQCGQMWWRDYSDFARIGETTVIFRAFQTNRHWPSFVSVW